MEKTQTAGQRIRQSRQRVNILKNAEFATIEYLCKRMPQWLKPDMLTAIGILGSAIVVGGLLLATLSKYFLLISILGFVIQWFGDSLDGRIAYYRNTPRKWYGWALDINADWISISLIGLGFYMYFPSFKALAFVFVLAYGGSMILSLLQYKLNNRYVIDRSALGPTELRIIICAFLLLEIWVPYALITFTAIASTLLIYINAKDSIFVLNEGDKRDIKEKIDKAIAY